MSIYKLIGPLFLGCVRWSILDGQFLVASQHLSDRFLAKGFLIKAVYPPFTSI